MKGDWLAIGTLVVIAGLMFQAIGLPVLPWIIGTLGGWVAAVPIPTEEFANLVTSLAWPLVTLAIALIFHGPLTLILEKLAPRIERDEFEIPGFLKVAKGTQLATLDRSAVSADALSEEAADVEVVEALLEFAGESDENAAKVLNWISTNLDYISDPEVFLSARDLASARARALRDLKGS